MTPQAGHESRSEPAFSFYGSYERAVDAKGRFNLPFRFRRKGGSDGEIDGYVVSIGRNECLTLWPAAAFKEAFERAKQTSDDDDWQDQLLVLSEQSSDVEPDTQGRVMVPVGMLEGVGIGRRVKVVGMNHFMELWDPERFEAVKERQPKPKPEFLKKLFF